ncbi:hypothetical protein ACWN8V_08330 [Vagococcus elongatus]|uniref:Uncharacterized protein n=1 Tax=Vagococcus elongatus TaxID=180344 RepID=A0A430AV07_9ENTE|nr:hypothetical protein [Vagococcus elongatus]RSU11886.1 hypothetical protein CBF29_07140 [Vagococcus elongatus]
MKYKLTLLMTLLLFSLLGGCSKKPADDKSTDITTDETAELTESSTKTSETTETSEFDTLSLSEQILLYANTVDRRINDYPGLEGLDLNYIIEGNDLYFQIHSGAGSGHPIFHLIIDENGILPLQGVCYVGITGYEATPVEETLVSKEELLDYYKKNQPMIQQATAKVKESTEIKQLFLDSLSYAGISFKNTDGSVEVTPPTEEQILNYFKMYVMDDLSNLAITADSKNQAHYGYGDEETTQLIIRFGGGFAYYVSIEGNRIIYTGYSFGGVRDDRTVEKIKHQDAYFDFATGEHGLL